MKDRLPTPFKCPVCDGTGIVSRPPSVAGDLDTWPSNQVGPWPCPACRGKCIVWHHPRPEPIRIEDTCGDTLDEVVSQYLHDPNPPKS